MLDLGPQVKFMVARILHLHLMIKFLMISPMNQLPSPGVHDQLQSPGV